MTAILCVGLAAVDVVLRVDHLPTEARKVRACGAAVVGGGCAANAAVAVARLGGLARLASHMGTDEIGALTLSQLARDGVDCALVHRDPAVTSSVSAILVDAAGERQIVNYRDPRFTDADAAWLTADLPVPDAILADTRWTAGAAVAMAAARRFGCPGVIDAEPPFEGLEPALAQASHVVFSEPGLAAYGGDLSQDGALTAAEQRLGGFVAVTLGARGVAWRSAGRAGLVPGFAVTAVDTTGAGDVWHGAFTLALAEGQDPASAMRWANAAAAIKCSRAGGRRGTPTRAELERFLGEARPCS